MITIRICDSNMVLERLIETVCGTPDMIICYFLRRHFTSEQNFLVNAVRNQVSVYKYFDELDKALTLNFDYFRRLIG